MLSHWRYNISRAQMKTFLIHYHVFRKSASAVSRKCKPVPSKITQGALSVATSFHANWVNSLDQTAHILRTAHLEKNPITPILVQHKRLKILQSFLVPFSPSDTLSILWFPALHYQKGFSFTPVRVYLSAISDLHDSAAPANPTRSP